MAQTALTGPDDGGLALRHGRTLLAALELDGDVRPLGDHPALAWRRSGLLEVTGHPDGPGLVCPVAMTAAADGALAALRAIAPGGHRLPSNGPALLGERARLMGLTRRAASSPGGTCRLLTARDGSIAVNLAREADWDLVEAWLGETAKDWDAIARLVASRRRDPLMRQGRLLGLPVADAAGTLRSPLPFIIERLAAPGKASGTPLVVDLSALWAGPLAGSLLQAAGARVWKVESHDRPDGARSGNPRFHDLLNSGKASLALDFRHPEHLRALVRKADIVIEGSRPRALQQLGIEARAEAARGATWISITGHGRTGEAANWTGFGDDAAVAGGLCTAMARGWREPLFAGDAIADPLTGITAALAGWAGWRTGGGVLVSLALSQVAANACALHEARPGELGRWQTMAEADSAPLYPLREASAGPARASGADNVLVDELTR